MTVTFALSRIEGGLALEQQDSGAIRLLTGPLRGLEARLTGRASIEAIYLTQQAGADAAVSQALAAAMAWENAAHALPPRDGAVLRDLLHALSFIHAHLRQLYLQALPDYLPWADLAGYHGSRPELARIARTLRSRPAGYWARQPQPHPFSASQVERLQENQASALEALAVVQRMLARIGGKFPMVMSVVPGGCSAPLTDALLVELRQELQRIAPVADGTAYEDAQLIVGAFPSLKHTGRSGMGLLCAGMLGEVPSQGPPMIPGGVWLGDRYAAYSSAPTESVAYSYYDLPPERRRGGPLLRPAPGKPRAYSWIKAPRHLGRPMEVGPLARLAVLHPTVSEGETADLLDSLVKTLGSPLTGASSIAGRTLARQAEVRILVRRCAELLDQLSPGEPTVADISSWRRVSSDGAVDVESPAGALRHRASFSGGSIALWDMIGPSTWNGSPRDEADQPGALESALSGANLDLTRKEDRLTASRIVHSYAFSAIDAVQ
jgi:Ni,Fe-hydrogenase I large subunit